MTTSETDDVARHVSQWSSRVWLLVLGHLALALVAAWLIGHTPGKTSTSGIFAFAIFPAQACLLGLWLDLSGTHRARKAIVAFSLLFCLALLLATAVSSSQAMRSTRQPPMTGIILWMLVILALPMVGTALASLTARKLAHLRLSKRWVRPTTFEGLQFGISHLLLLTAIVALLLGLGKITRNALGGPGPSIAHLFAWIALTAVCWTATVLVIVWATLGTGRPHERAIVAILFSLFAGFWMAYSLVVSWESVWEFPASTVSMGLIVTGSLLVIRRDGYRLVRLGQGAEGVTGGSVPHPFDE